MCNKMVTEMKVGDVIYEDDKCKVVVTEVIETPQGPEVRAKGYKKEVEEPYNIYEEAVKLMKPEEIDHHESDLYLMVTPVSRKLVEKYPHKSCVHMFKSQIEPYGLWYEIYFAYTPEWDRAARVKEDVEFIKRLNERRRKDAEA